MAYHAYQSFKPGEVTPELCHQLGVELAKRMWGDEYQVLVAAHFNTGTYQRYKPMPIQRHRPKHLRLNGSFRTVKKIGGFRGLYLHYCYCLGILPKGSNHHPLSPELREECRRLDAISRQAQLICQEKLGTGQDVEDFISVKQAEIRN